MRLRLAQDYDLDRINSMFKELISDMHRRDVTIWNDYYPFFMFQEDIQKERMYLLENDEDIVSVFVLAKDNNGEASIEWNETTKNVFYLDRFAVNVKYLQKGYGAMSLRLAEGEAKRLGAKYMRLFVVPSNVPAIKLYEKCNYQIRKGLYILEDDNTITMYGYEKELI